MSLTQDHISEVMVTVNTNPKPCPGHKLSKLDLDNISRNRIMTLKQGHIAKGKVTVYTWQIFSRPLLFIGPLDGGDTSHNCCQLQTGCCCGGICPVGTCLV